MNLPKVIEDLIKAQNSFNSESYTNCFSETAIVYDEGKTYNGKAQIQQWIQKANKEYKAVMNPVAYDEGSKVSILSAEISGSFPGSPVVLQFHFELENGLVQSLRISA